MLEAKIEKLLAERGMTLTTLADLTGIARADLSRAVKGQIEFWPGWKIRVAAALQIPAGILFEGCSEDSTKRNRYMHVRELIKEKGLSIRQIAHMSGMASQSLYDAFSGAKPFYPAWKKRVATALGESVADLFGDESK